MKGNNLNISCSGVYNKKEFEELVNENFGFLKKDED